MRGDLPSISAAVLCISSGISCTAFPPSAAPGPSHTHTHTDTHTHWGMVLYTNTHTHKFLFFLFSPSVSHRLTPVWFHLLCSLSHHLSILTYSFSHAHTLSISGYSLVPSLSVQAIPPRDNERCCGMTEGFFFLSWAASLCPPCYDRTETSCPRLILCGDGGSQCMNKRSANTSSQNAGGLTSHLQLLRAYFGNKIKVISAEMMESIARFLSFQIGHVSTFPSFKSKHQRLPDSHQSVRYIQMKEAVSQWRAGPWGWPLAPVVTFHPCCILLGHDCQWLNNHRRAAKDRVGFPLRLFCLQTKEVLKFSGGLIRLFPGRPGNSH